MALPSAGPTDCSSGLSQRIFQNLSYDSKWVANQAGYAVGARACPTTPNGFGYQVSAITTGTTSGSEPTWPVIINNTVADGGVTWKCIETANPTGRVLSVNPGYVLTTADLDAFRLLAYDVARGVADEIGGGADYCAASATSTAGQSITSGAFATIVFGTEEKDTDNAYDNTTGIFTVPTGKDGDYDVFAQVGWAAALTATDVEIAIFVGSTNKRDYTTVNPAAFQCMPISTLLPGLVGGNTVKIQVFHNAGVAKSLGTTAANNYFSIARRLGS